MGLIDDVVETNVEAEHGNDDDPSRHKVDQEASCVGSKPAPCSELGTPDETVTCSDVQAPMLL